MKRICVLGAVQDQAIAPGEAHAVVFDHEFVDPDGLHRPNTPSVIPKQTQDLAVFGRATLTGLQAGDRVRIQVSGHDPRNGAYVYEVHGVDKIGDGRDPYSIDLCCIDVLGRGVDYRLRIINPNDYALTITESQLRLAV